MSMIIICQSNYDLKRYGLKNAYNVGFLHIREIAKKLKLNGKIWSNDVFGFLCEECYNYITLNSYNNSFLDTPLYYFISELLEVCDKIAIFYCEPLSDLSDWIFSSDKELFLTELENIVRKDINYVTLVFDRYYK